MSLSDRIYGGSRGSAALPPAMADHVPYRVRSPDQALAILEHRPYRLTASLTQTSAQASFRYPLIFAHFASFCSIIFQSSVFRTFCTSGSECLQRFRAPCYDGPIDRFGRSRRRQRYRTSRLSELRYRIPNRFSDRDRQHKRRLTYGFAPVDIVWLRRAGQEGNPEIRGEYPQLLESYRYLENGLTSALCHPRLALRLSASPHPE